MSDQVTLTIDEQEVTVPKGTLVIDAAAKLGIEIPMFCSHPKLDPVACCRMCLVEMDGPRGTALLPACAIPAGQDAVVRTATENVQETQEAMLGFILLNHPLDCPICDKGGECPLQDQTMKFGPGISQLVEPKRHKNKDYLISDTIVLDQERCVVCWRCIRYLEEWEDKPQLGLFERGGETIIDIQHGQPVDSKTGGNIIDICPVGALTNRVARFNFRPWQIERTASVDPHFATGDNIRIDTRTHKIRRIIGRENMQVNDQWIADKTRFAYEWANSEDRLDQPLVRKGGQLVPATWNEALEMVAQGLRRTAKTSGADSVGAIGSAKLSNESNYLLQRLFRGVIGTNNVDHRNGSDVAAIATGVPALTDVMKPQYGPDPQVDTIVLFGFDPSEEAPILDVHLKRAVRRGGAKLIIAHPRKIELTRYHGPYLGYTPGTEVALLNALAKEVMDEGENADAALSQLLAGASQHALLETCGVGAEEVKAAAALLNESENTLILYGPLAASGPDGEQALNGLTNLAILTGNYERLAYIGLDANSQGCRDMGMLPSSLPGYGALDDEMARSRFEEAWNCTLASSEGKGYKSMLDSAGEDLKALYIMGANPASERADWAAALEKLDFLVVQDLFLTETAALADVVLPAVSWAEQDGTFTSCERRVQHAPKAFNAPHSKAAADWLIVAHLAHFMNADWAFDSAASVLNEITQVVPIYEGLTWESLGDQGLQWDASKVRPQPAYRQAEQAEIASNEDRPFALVGGTVTYDGGTLFSLTEQMKEMAFGSAVGMNPKDAEARGLQAESDVTVRSSYGELALRVVLNEQVQPGTVWIPESLPNAPVGSLLNGSSVEYVQVIG
ncbi:MAG: NADH-quinone oxidoreductase subunit NuoG [Chloroflexota bacterium]